MKKNDKDQNINYSLPKKSLSKIVENSTVWEDPEVIQKALDINKNDKVLSITSAGCNILNFLLHDPEEIISVDFNPYQNFILELKMAGIRDLSHDEFLKLLGVRPSQNRAKIYNQVRDGLEYSARNFWDANIHLIEKGLIYNGPEELIVSFFGKYLQFIRGKQTIEWLFRFKTIEEQADFFYKYVYGFPWRLLFNIVFRRNLFKLRLCGKIISETLRNKKRPPDEDFQYIKKITYSIDVMKQAENVFTSLPLKNNYFTSLWLFGYYYNNCLPPYLKKDVFPILKKRVDRIKIKTDSLQNVLKNSSNNYYTKFNLSNVLDLLNENEFKQQLKEITRVGKNLSRFCYFITHIDRRIPKNLKGITPEKTLGNQLFKESRVFTYGGFEVGEVTK